MKLVVGRMRGAAEPEIGGTRGQRITVEDDLRVSAVARHATDQLVLAAVAISRQVFERPVGARHRRVILLDPRPHFTDELLLQILRGRENGLAICILCFKVTVDIGRQHRRLAQHLLPVLVLEPGVVVGHGHAVHAVNR